MAQTSLYSSSNSSGERLNLKGTKKLFTYKTQDYVTKENRTPREFTLCKLYDRSDGDRVLSFDDVIEGLINERSFCQFFSSTLDELVAGGGDGGGGGVGGVEGTTLSEHPTSNGDKAFVWECVPVSESTARETDFMFVYYPNDALSRMNCDYVSFQEHFSKAVEQGVSPSTSFINLGRDARLVTPLPKGENRYTHLSAFQRTAPAGQKLDFWETVGKCFRETLKDNSSSTTTPKWLSTNGLGVGWLHVRIDERPKYYGFPPFRRYPPLSCTTRNVDDDVWVDK